MKRKILGSSKTFANEISKTRDVPQWKLIRDREQVAKEKLY